MTIYHPNIFHDHIYCLWAASLKLMLGHKDLSIPSCVLSSLTISNSSWSFSSLLCLSLVLSKAWEKLNHMKVKYYLCQKTVHIKIIFKIAVHAVPWCFCYQIWLRNDIHTCIVITVFLKKFCILHIKFFKKILQKYKNHNIHFFT